MKLPFEEVFPFDDPAIAVPPPQPASASTPANKIAALARNRPGLPRGWVMIEPDPDTPGVDTVFDSGDSDKFSAPSWLVG